MGTFNTLTLSDAGDADDRDNDGGMDAEPIYRYTRAQAIADGVLIDVTQTAHEAGFRWPVAITDALMRDIRDIPMNLEGIASEDGRIWDCLWMAFCAIRTSRTPDDTQLIYSLLMSTSTSRRRYHIKLVSGPGDDAEPVITLMQPDES